jgi:uncharacterized protein YjiK
LKTNLICIGILLMNLAGCDRDPDPEINLGSLQLLTSTAIVVPEPSGLTSDGAGGFWTVSDHTGHVYHLNSQGGLIDELSWNGVDLEGISRDPLTGDLLIVEEAVFNLVRLDIDGNEISRIDLSEIGGDPGSGLEGICTNGENSWILKEKSPGLLLKVNAVGSLISSRELEFAGDYSAIDRDTNGDLWILSDESELLAHCDPQGNPRVLYAVDLPKPEGLVIDSAAGKLWIVSDARNTLYEFEFPITE